MKFLSSIYFIFTKKDRALQVCFPSILEELTSNTLEQDVEVKNFETSRLIPAEITPNVKGPRVRTIVRILSLYASFLERAKGDVDASSVVLRKAIQVSYGFCSS